MAKQADPSRADSDAALDWLPALHWLPRYQRKDLKGDTLGALTAWAIIIPESVAYAQIAGVPPQNAFYAAPIALIFYALWGSSRTLIVGATSAASILSASTVAAVALNTHDTIELSAALGLVAGVILVVAGLFKLGFITNFLSEPALTGFLFGMALIIVVRQVAKIVGTSSGDGDFFQRVYTLLSNINEWSAASIVVGVAAIVALLALEQYLPRLPASLIVLIAGIAISAAANLQAHGIEVVGTVPSAVPSLHIPDVTWSQVGQLVGGGFGIALIVFAESFSVGNRFARLHDYEVNANQELIGLGAANVGAGLFQGFAVSGSASRTAAVDGARATTQVTGLIAAVLVIITAAFLTPLFTDLPEPVLAAIVIVAIRGFLRVGTMRMYWQRDRPTFAIAFAALMGVLTFDLLPGLIIAVGLSMLLFIAYSSAPRVAELRPTAHGDFLEARTAPDLVRVPGAIVVRVDGGLFFGNVNQVRHSILDLVRSEPTPPRVFLLSLSASYRLGLPVLDALRELNQDLETLGPQLWLVDVASSARRQLDQDPLAADLGAHRIWRRLSAAMDHYGTDN